MKFITNKPRFSRTIGQRISLLVAIFLVAASLFAVFPQSAAAGQLTSRSLAVSSSLGNTSSTWTFTFSVAATTALNGISFQPCTTASGTCTTPTSWTNSGATFSSLTYNGSSQSSWALDNAAGYLRIKNNSSAATVSNPVVATFNTVTNPDTTNETFFVRILTYTGDDFTGQLDSGVVASSTSQSITVSATVDESLSFCTGTSGVSTSSCSGATGSSVGLQTAGSSNVTSSSTAFGTSQLGVGTNANSGYAITVNGVTLTSGGNTISALASQTASTTGNEQFGLNLKDNATPNVGSEADGSGSGTATANYGTVDQYRFVTGDSVASKNGAELFRRYTVSYIANITTATEAGSYSSALTYICTATF